MSGVLPFTPRRVAVIRALYLGDLLLAVPALRALRAGLPDAEITLIGLPWAVDFAARYARYVDRFVPFAGYPGLPEVPVDPVRTAAWLAEQRAERYDVVVQMHGSGGASNPLALALGGQATVGYYEGAPPAGLTLGAPYPHAAHEVHRVLGLARLLGCPADDTTLEFPLRPSERAAALALVPALADRSRPWVGFHPGAAAPARRWPPVQFAALGDLLAREHGARIVLTGGPGEEPLAAAIAARMQAPAVNVAGRTPLGTLGALVDALDLYVTNDSGPAHLVAAVGTPSITIFGPGDPHGWAPLDAACHPVARLPVACSPCRLRVCPIDHRCLRWLAPATLGALAARLLARKAAA